MIQQIYSYTLKCLNTKRIVITRQCSEMTTLAGDIAIEAWPLRNRVFLMRHGLVSELLCHFLISWSPTGCNQEFLIPPFIYTCIDI